MNNSFEKATAAAFYIRKKTDIVSFGKAIITGTGLGEIWKSLKLINEIDYMDIPHFQRNTVQSHSGKMYVCKVGESHHLILSGRFHLYEGYSPSEVAFPVRVLQQLGVQELLVTNVAGGLNTSFQAGSIVAVTDHINFQPQHVLRGENEERWGPRFPDMLKRYDHYAYEHLRAFAQKEDIPLHHGVYLALQGPSLETPAEYEMIKRMGADLVGMSTVPEVLAAAHMDLKIAVLSVVSNMCYPIESITKTTVEEVIAVAKKTVPSLEKLCNFWLERE